MAGENNPQVKASFHDYLAALEKVPQVGSLPNPELSIGIFLKPMERFMGNQQADVQLMQMFPWFGMLRTQKDEASMMAMAKYAEFLESKNILFYQVKNSWYQLYQLEAEIRIIEENLKILQTYERMALIRLKSSGSVAVSGGSAMQKSNSMGNSSANTSMGSMSGGVNTGSKSATVDNASMGSATSPMVSGNSSMGDVLRIRMEINDLENSRAQLIDNRFPLQAELNQLLNRNINEQISVIDNLEATVLSIDRNALLDSITENNPMLKMLDAEVEALEAQKKMARLEGLPMFGVGVNYIPFSPRMDAGMAMGGENMLMPMVKLTIPIYRKKYSAMHKEAELKQQAMRYRRENTVNHLNTQWSVALRDLDDATRRTALYKTQSELAQQTLNVLMTSYSTDGSDFEDVLKVQQQLLNYQLKMITSIVDQHLTMAMLENLSATEMNNWAQ